MAACEWSLRAGPWELERCRRLAGLSRPGRDRTLASSSSCGVAGGWGPLTRLATDRGVPLRQFDAVGWGRISARAASAGILAATGSIVGELTRRRAVTDNDGHNDVLRRRVRVRAMLGDPS